MTDVLITAGATVVVALISLVGNYMVSNKNAALMNYRLNQIEEKQDKHNNLIERMVRAESEINKTQSELKTAFKRIDETRADIHSILDRED